MRKIVVLILISEICLACCPNNQEKLEGVWIIEELYVNGNLQNLENYIINTFSFRSKGSCSFPTPLNAIELNNIGEWEFLGYEDDCRLSLKIRHPYYVFSGHVIVSFDPSKRIHLVGDDFRLSAVSAFSHPFIDEISK